MHHIMEIILKHLKKGRISLIKEIQEIVIFISLMVKAHTSGVVVTGMQKATNDIFHKIKNINV